MVELLFDGLAYLVDARPLPAWEGWKKGIHYVVGTITS